MFSELLRWIFGDRAREAKKVLIVEDDDFLKPIMARILYSEIQKLDLTWVASVDQAKFMLSRHSYDFLITDILLEGHGNGAGLYKYCKLHHPQMPVMIISGLSENTIAKMGVTNLGSDEYLSKPIAAWQCRQSIRSLMNL